MLLPSLRPNNKVYKEKVGQLIFPFVKKLAPEERVPKITGMLIELPMEHVREYMSCFDVLEQMVEEANELISEQKVGE
jgi:hypothetical protein